MKDSHELARLCSLDIGQEVTADEVRNYLLVGERALERFSPEDRRDLFATLAKELLSP
jgi:hypothetical protein